MALERLTQRCRPAQRGVQGEQDGFVGREMLTKDSHRRPGSGTRTACGDPHTRPHYDAHGKPGLVGLGGTINTDENRHGLLDVLRWLVIPRGRNHNMIERKANVGGWSWDTQSLVAI